jgi:hypothetical protein
VSEREREREGGTSTQVQVRMVWPGMAGYGWVFWVLGMGMIWYRGMEVYRYGIRLEIRDFAGWTKLPRLT